MGIFERGMRVSELDILRFFHIFFISFSCFVSAVGHMRSKCNHKWQVKTTNGYPYSACPNIKRYTSREKDLTQFVKVLRLYSCSPRGLQPRSRILITADYALVDKSLDGCSLSHAWETIASSTFSISFFTPQQTRQLLSGGYNYGEIHTYSIYYNPLIFNRKCIFYMYNYLQIKKVTVIWF